MIQGVSKQFLEAASKYAHAMAQNASSSQNTGFKSYMQDVGSKRDAGARTEHLGKKDVQKPQDHHAKKNEARNDEASNDATTKDSSITKVDDKGLVKDEGDMVKDNAKISDAAQNLIDVSALLMQLSDNMLTDAQTLQISNVIIGGVEQQGTEGMPLLTKPQGELQAVAMISDAQMLAQGTAEVSNKVQVLPQEAVISNQLPTEKTTEKTTETKENTVIKAETMGAKATQVVNNGENAKNAKTSGENAEAAKETLSKAGEAKPIEIKIEVKTNQNQTQTSQQSKTEETTDAQALMAKPEKAEMPTITVKVGDGGQINSQQMAEDVADAIIKKMPQKPNEFEIQITPKELGNITIKLLFENGQTLVSLSSNNAKTAGLLSECAKTIGAMIQQHTGNETIVTVQDDKNFTDQQKQEGNRQNAESQQQENAKKQQRQQGASQDFVQQMRLGLFDGDFSDSRSRFY